MPERKCGSCRHFEPAPMWKRGWCRNPLLFAQHQSHLVGEDDLDCNRGMGSYWEELGPDEADVEPVVRFNRPAQPQPQPETTGRFIKPAPRTIAPAGANAASPRRGPEPISVRRDGVETIERPRVRAATKPARPAAPTGNYSPPQESYSWGEYLRRSYPAIGIILLLGVLWVWSARYLSTTGVPTPTPQLVVPTAAVAAPVAVITPTAAPAPAASTLPAAPPGTIGPGARVIVQTPGGAGANIRVDPTTAAAVVTALDDGSPLTITGASQDADGYTWWPVQGDGIAGWVAAALIALP